MLMVQSLGIGSLLMSYAVKACRSPSVGCGGYAPLLRRSLVIARRKPCGKKTGAAVYDGLL